eukprot:5229909-Pleurochrysis_carterae.AAC.2
MTSSGGRATQVGVTSDRAATFEKGEEEVSSKSVEDHCQKGEVETLARTGQGIMIQANKRRVRERGHSVSMVPARRFGACAAPRQIAGRERWRVRIRRWRRPRRPPAARAPPKGRPSAPTSRTARQPARSEERERVGGGSCWRGRQKMD